jgi:hypothetical protein
MLHSLLPFQIKVHLDLGFERLHLRGKSFLEFKGDTFMLQISKGQVFRQKALDKAFAADELDQTMLVTRPTGWLALLVVAVVMVFALVWSLTGSLSIKVDASGVLLDDGAGGNHAVLFIPVAKQKSVRPGMNVQMTPAGFPPQQYGYLLGAVRHVGQYPLTSQNLEDILKNDGLAAVFRQDGPRVVVNVELQRNTSTPGYAWSGGRKTQILAGTLLQASIIVDERRPIDLLLPGRVE